MSENLIAYLIHRKFYATGPIPNTEFQSREQRVLEYKAVLRNLSKDRLAVLVYEERARELKDPNPFTQFYWPHNSAWARMAYWSLDEAIGLSLGLEPEAANWAVKDSQVNDHEIAADYSYRRELAMRAVKAKQLLQACSG